jgi:4-alpha-glucanotransferase
MARARLSARAALAARAGILPEYVDQTGVLRRTSESTRIALLAAMGLAADTEARARAALAALDARAAREIIAPVRVVPPRAARALAIRSPLPARAGRVRWRLEISAETGETRRSEGTLRTSGGACALRLPFAPAPGYYRVRLGVAGAGEEHAAEQTLVVTPGRCATPADLGLVRGGGAHPGRGVFGLLANLYTVRSGRNWGAGDLTDLGDLVGFAAAIGAAFVGINPLHALGNAGGEISPYWPLSRLYRNPLYLDVTAVPELLESPAAQARLARAATRDAIAALRAADRIEYAAVMAEKDSVLRELHQTFVARHRGRGTARARAYEHYRDAEGESLVDVATFLALRTYLSAADPAMRDWHRWPARYRDRGSRAVATFRAEHGAAVDYHCYVQFELDRQLAAVAERVRAGGLAIGVYQDLALGSSPKGADPWSHPGLFLEDGVSIGAPPDPLGPLGQNWGLPPIDPTALARDGYRYWIRLVRTAFRHAGALRIDHVMGLFRQFWIPAGRDGSEGAYVRMPADDLLGILALESVRARALVIGEDLGTVPAGLPRELARRGILSMRVLYFARDVRGRFAPARRYPPRALVCANTHDLAPLAGFWQGRDLVLRRRVGQIPNAAALAAAERERAAERIALVRRLRDDADLTSEAPTHHELTAAVHTFLARTPAALVGLSLDDLAGEVDPVNLPGTSLDVYPSWSRKMRRALEDLVSDPEVRAALGDAPELRGRRGVTRRRRRSRAMPRPEERAATARPSRSRRRARSRAR